MSPCQSECKHHVRRDFLPIACTPFATLPVRYPPLNFISKTINQALHHRKGMPRHPKGIYK
jgi:hypothetical protein